MIFPVMRPNIRGEGWVPGRLGQCLKFDQIFILMASLSLDHFYMWTIATFVFCHYLYLPSKHTH